VIVIISSNKADFSAAIFSAIQTALFNNIVFERPNEVSFSNNDLSNVSFAGSDVTRVGFGDKIEISQLHTF